MFQLIGNLRYSAKKITKDNRLRIFGMAFSCAASNVPLPIRLAGICGMYSKSAMTSPIKIIVRIGASRNLRGHTKRRPRIRWSRSAADGNDRNGNCGHLGTLGSFCWDSAETAKRAAGALRTPLRGCAFPRPPRNIYREQGASKSGEWCATILLSAESWHIYIASTGSGKQAGWGAVNGCCART